MPGPELRSAGVTSFNRHKVLREEKEMQMALQCIKRSLSLLIVREITVKTTLTAKQIVGRQVFFFFLIFVYLSGCVGSYSQHAEPFFLFLVAACGIFSCHMWDLVP